MSLHMAVPLRPNVRRKRRALQGPHASSRANAAGRLIWKSTDPEEGTETAEKSPDVRQRTLQGFDFFKFVGLLGLPASPRAFCPASHYLWPSGIVRISLSLRCAQNVGRARH